MTTIAAPDIREALFAPIRSHRIRAALIADDPGVLAGVRPALEMLAGLGLAVDHVLDEGAAVRGGAEILRLSGTPMQVAMAEERVIGLLAKPSGIATAAAAFVARAAGRPRIVSGAWKKLPFGQKDMIRSAITIGGAEPRIAQWPFTYIDKNMVAMLGGARATLQVVAGLPARRTIIQLGGADIASDACHAAACGVQVVFVDTGRVADLEQVAGALRARGLRDKVELAFGGGVRLVDLDTLRELDVDTVDVGRAIVDAPLLDMSLRVLEVVAP